MTSFSNLNLNPKILAALEKKGYVTPTPIQLQAIPSVLEGRDILGIAQTGTGKTAAFALPILHNLAKSGISVKSGCVRALILSPTRELASQISENIEAYSKDLNLRHTVIYGGVSDRGQITALQRGIDILIATPGRLMDLASQGYIRFMQVEVLVLDEADRMLDMGFINDINKIIAKIPQKRQTLFFSATMPTAITNLSKSILTDPVRIEVTPQSTTVERIDQKIMFVEKRDKLALLRNILRQEDATSVIVFLKTKHGADDVEDFLDRNRISVAAIHGDKDQDQREKSLNRFREGKIKVLVATDVAARGIDIPAISHVVNYDIPSDPESYVHRIGRTARAGRQGIAISFADPHDDTLLLAVEKAINYKIPVDDSHAFSAKKSSLSSKNDEARNKNPNANKRQSRARSDEKVTQKKPHHAEKKKKNAILNFLFGLFKGQKSEVREEEKGPQRKPQHPQRNKDQRPQRKPEPRQEKVVRERPQPKSDKPVFKGGSRKISSGKKEE